MRRFVSTAVAVVSIAAVLVGWAGPAEAGGSCHQPRTDRAGTIVATESGCFVPLVVRVGVGESLTFANRDGLPHTVTASGGTWGGDLPAGRSLTVRFAEPGVYPYYCHFHPGMIGAVVVGDGAPPQVAGVASTALTNLLPSAARGAADSNPPWPALFAVPLVAALAGIALARRLRRVDAEGS